MSIIPKKEITLTTKISKEEVLKRIDKSKKYKGRVDNNSFRIQRVINYRNTYFPQITGNVYEENNLTRVEVNMTLDIITLVCIGIWMVIMLFFNSFFPDFSIMFYDMDLPPYIIDNMHYLVVAISIAGMYAMFHWKCEQNKEHLQEILDAEIVTNTK